MEYRLKLLIVASAVFCVLLPQIASADYCMKTLYIDGAKIGDYNVPQGLQWPYERITIGAEGDRWWLYNEYIGKMDEFAIYAGILSDPCIAAHYAAKDSNAAYTAVVTNDNPLLWLRFEDASTDHNDVAANSGSIGIDGQYVTTGGGAITQVTGINADSNAINIPDAIGDPEDENIDRQGHCVDVWDGNGDFGEDLEGDVTIELWVNFTDFNSMAGNDYPRLFQHNSAWDNPAGYGLMINNAPNEVGVMGGGHTAYMGFPFDINDANWHHLVVTYDSYYEPYEPNTYVEEVMADDPCLYIRFEEDDPCDYSGNNYWVEASDAVVIEKTIGSMGKAARLNGGWVAAAPNVSEPCLPTQYGHQYAFVPNDITIEFWLYVPESVAVDGFASFFTQCESEPEDPPPYYSPAATRGESKCRIMFGDTRDPDQGGYAYTAADTWKNTDQNWHHYVFIWDEIPDVNGDPYQIRVMCYADGTSYKDSTYGKDTNVDAWGFIGPEMDHILIGRYGTREDPSGNAYREYIDEFAIYEGILPVNRIQAHRDAWAPKSCAEWRDRGLPMPAHDRNKDCIIDFVDFASFVSDWRLCNDPCDANCIPNW